jgi:hypothetical protein
LVEKNVITLLIDYDVIYIVVIAMFHKMETISVDLVLPEKEIMPS